MLESSLACFSIDIIDSLAQGYLEDLNDDMLEKVITSGVEVKTKGATSMIYILTQAPLSNAYPIFAQQGYENPREATGRIVCANCHLANKPVDIEVPQAVLPDTVFEAVVRIRLNSTPHSFHSSSHSDLKV